MKSGLSFSILVRELQEGNVSQRKEAAVRLGEMSDVRAIQYLSDALDDEEFEVRLNAVSAIGRIGGPDAIEHLTRVLNDILENVAIRRIAAVELGKTKNPDAVEHLVRTLNDFYEFLEIRKKAVSALGNIGGSDAIDSLFKVLRDPKELPPIRIEI